MEKIEIQVGDVFMTTKGIGQVTVLHGAYTDHPFQVRIAGTKHNVAMGYDSLLWKISK